MACEGLKYFFVFIVASGFLCSCENDIGPLIKQDKLIAQKIQPKSENNTGPCDCDVTPYRDCFCDTNDPYYDCSCDTTQYIDCDCDRDTRFYFCPCDETIYRDCWCDVEDPDYNCPCDTTIYRDCSCDTTDPVYYCPCDLNPWDDPGCDCDSLQKPYYCPCDVTQYYDCVCDKDTGTAPVDPPVYFSEIKAILAYYCDDCHYSGANIPCFESSCSYQTIIDYGYAIVSAPEASTIYTIVKYQTMPPGGPYLTEDEIDKILKWIEQGAQNNK